MKVTITALPRQEHPGFGAIQRYFKSGVPEQIEVTDAEYKELHEDPAKFFLKVEEGWTEAEPQKPADPPAKPTKK